MRRLGLAIAILTLAATAALATTRRAAILTVVIDEVSVGDHIVYLEDHDVLLPVEVLQGAGLAVRGPFERVDGVDYIALGALHLQVVIDEDHMTLRLTAAVTDLPGSRIDLGARRPSGFEYRDATSLYVNYGVHTVGSRPDGFSEGGLRIHRALVYSSATWLPDHHIVRGLSNVTIDDRDALFRVVAGDQIISGGPLGGGGVVGGVHLIRSFDLDPYVVTAPSIDMTGSVLVPATADIYVNGVLVRRVQLAPGQYTLANLPVTSGAGDTRIVLHDVLGRQQELSTGYYMPSGLLRPGLSDYQVAAGVLREHMGVSSFDYDEPVMIARYRRGLASYLTAGVRGDATTDQAGAGVSLSVGLPFGQVDTALATSSDRGSLGAAGSLAWSYLARRGAVSIYGRRVGARYATVDVNADADRATTEGRVQASAAIGRRLAVGAQIGATDFRDSGWSRRTSVQATVVPAGGCTLSITIGRSDPWNQAASYDLMASLTVGLAKRTRASVTQQHRVNADRTEIELNRSLDGQQPSIGYRALVDRGDLDRAYGAIQAQTRFGRYEVGYTYADQHSGPVEITAAGGLAVIGGRVFASTPIDRSFALVRVPGVSGVEASLENHPTGRTDAGGDVFVPNLQPYYGNNVSIDARDLPLDRALPALRQVVAPPVGGGAVITFAAPPLHLVRGRLRIESRGVARIPAYGELSVTGGTTPFLSPVGADGEFELDGVLVGHHTATVEWAAGTCRFDLVVPNDRQSIIDVGTTICRIPDAGVER